MERLSPEQRTFIAWLTSHEDEMVALAALQSCRAPVCREYAKRRAEERAAEARKDATA